MVRWTLNRSGPELFAQSKGLVRRGGSGGTGHRTELNVCKLPPRLVIFIVIHQYRRVKALHPKLS